VLAGEAKWAKRVDASRLHAELLRKVEALPRCADDLRYAVCVRESVEHAGEMPVVTAEDIF